MVGTAMLTATLRAFETVHLPDEAASGTATWRSMNISTSCPINSAIEIVPIDQASLEAVLAFIVDADCLRPAAGKGNAGCRTVAISRRRDRIAISLVDPQRTARKEQR